MQRVVVDAKSVFNTGLNQPLSKLYAGCYGLNSCEGIEPEFLIGVYSGTHCNHGDDRINEFSNRLSQSIRLWDGNDRPACFRGKSSVQIMNHVRDIITPETICYLKHDVVFLSSISSTAVNLPPKETGSTAVDNDPNVF